MTQLITKTTDSFQSLKSASQTLPIPADYFSGFGEGRIVLKPENLLLFSRTTASELVEMEGMPMKINQHSRWVLIMNLQGEGSVLIGENSYALIPGKILLIRPFEVHTISELKDTEPNWLFLTFDLSIEMHDYLVKHRYYQEATDWFWQLSRACVETYMAKSDLVRNSTPYVASLMLVEMIDNNQADHDRPFANNPLPDAYKRVRAFMKATDSADWNISNAAKYCNLSASRLRVLFKESMQMSLGSYFQHCRLMNAAKELKTTNKSLTELSEQSGYDSVYSFSRAFKSMFGTPPGAYRRSAL
ncbi:AraC family transcriptional regulator [Rubellicoccus peritrichatus]|uniref:AraC family transcriptional regulator n=1 Tax=Rubellicoccus peritrichatus TaxID=3080537 RepID=A0AAQ3LB17_9BACT|nr:AraC family transcriptional regulator [Puniceicoccus sp. CR14]WOO40630.1 AraC family transcriptional regulator [Puniceicoccus sp. CR14]